MKKSGLADSPFFATPQKGEPTPPLQTDEGSTNTNTTPLSETIDVLMDSQVQNEENQYQKRTSERSNERSIDRTDERSIIKPKRNIIRHSFDIYKDQLQALQLKQFEAVQKGKRKPKLGKMVQQAIDLYLKKASSK